MYFTRKTLYNNYRQSKRFLFNWYVKTFLVDDVISDMKIVFTPETLNKVEKLVIRKDTSCFYIYIFTL